MHLPRIICCVLYITDTITDFFGDKNIQKLNNSYYNVEFSSNNRR
jgi:hypothetical protein